MNKQFKFLAIAFFLAASSNIFATADTLRVVRGSILTKTSSPIVTNLTVEGTYTGPAVVSTINNFTVTKATPVITASANTNTAAKFVANGGSSSDASIVFQSSAVAKWAIGNDNSASHGFAISTGGALGTTDRLQITAAGATTITGATSLSSTLAVTGAQTLTGVTTHGAAEIMYPITLAASATTVNAALGNIFVTVANGGATAIDTINNPTTGQYITFVGGSATNASTIADSGNFKLTAAMTLGLNDTLTVYIAGATTWIEVGRADN